MKKLQSNFTTPEQSKRLLELGVPMNSANCYITWKLDHTPKVNVLDNETYLELIDHMSQITIPCWSVGRLIEILKECTNNEDDLIDIFVELQYSNDILTTILMIFRDNKAILDFSKFELV
jgi:hypothetical protein